MLLLAIEKLPNDETADLYRRFLEARESAIFQEIRRACGITQVSQADAEDSIPDDLAEDVMAGDGTAEEEEIEDLEFEFG